MMTDRIITPEIRELIIKNCSLSNDELRSMILDQFGVDVPQKRLSEIVRDARRIAEEATRACDAHISKKIAERVDDQVVSLMEILEREIQRIADALEGNDPRLRCRPDVDQDGNPTGYVSTRDYVMLSKELREHIKAYVSLRPPSMTVRVESSVDEESAFLEFCTPEELAVIEQVKKRYEEAIGQAGSGANR